MVHPPTRFLGTLDMTTLTGSRRHRQKSRQGDILFLWPESDGTPFRSARRGIGLHAGTPTRKRRGVPLSTRSVTSMGTGKARMSE